MIDEIVVSEYWSEDKTKHTRVMSSETIYPNMFKLVIKESEQPYQMFKFFKDLDKANFEAKNYVIG